MRSMSMLQLLGGVAAAGVVAAGTTAFTAGGVDATSLKMVAGGTTAITVEGANVTAATFVNGSTPGTYDRVTGVTITLAGTGGATISDSSDVSFAFTGTGETGAAVDGTYFDCGAGSGGVWICTTTTPANDYWTHIDTVNIKVAAL